jgi:hypothetical protein
MELYRASFESRSFSFEAYGKTEDEAEKVMMKGLRKHTKNYGLPNNDWWERYDINVNKFELGKAYCDYYEL